jgi:hypothetical protein
MLLEMPNRYRQAMTVPEIRDENDFVWEFHPDPAFEVVEYFWLWRKIPADKQLDAQVAASELLLGVVVDDQREALTERLADTSIAGWRLAAARALVSHYLQIPNQWVKAKPKPGKVIDLSDESENGAEVSEVPLS